jgi:hypothetical protein
MTSRYKKLAVAAAGAVVSFAAMPSGEALAQAIDPDAGKYGQVIKGAQRGEGFTVEDLTIKRSGRNEDVGNGIDESIEWTFDFTANPDLLSEFLNAPGELTSAELVFLEIGVTNSRITTDWFGIPGWEGQKFGFGSQVDPKGYTLVRVPDIEGIPDVGEFGSLTIDLLENGFTSGDIIDTLVDDTQHTNPWYNPSDWVGNSEYDHAIENGFGKIPFIYMDDAILREVGLTLTKGDVTINATSSMYPAPPVPTPVPEPSAIAGLAVLGGALLLNKKKKQG